MGFPPDVFAVEIEEESAVSFRVRRRMFCVAGPAELVEHATLIGISSGFSKRPRRTSPCSDDYAQRLLAQWATSAQS